MKQAPTPDHKAVAIAKNTSSNTRGNFKGYWKINNSTLNEENYKVGINKLFDDLLEEYGQDVPKLLLWEFLKLKIKEFTISYCTSRSLSVKQNIKDLEEKIDEIDRSHDSLTNDQYDERKKLKQELDNLYENRAKGYQVRSRAKWVECGEKSTRYFLGLEKTRKSANCITCLKDADGIPHHSDAEILKVAKSYHERLYKSNASQEDDIDLFLESLPKERILNDTESSQCEGLITVEECTVALKKMKHNKSPGLDGITTEFYQAFWPLCHALVDATLVRGQEFAKVLRVSTKIR